MFFFFQAEDGIRDYKVTGVQTCALPIFAPGATDCSGPVADSRYSFPETPSVKRQGAPRGGTMALTKWCCRAASQPSRTSRERGLSCAPVVSSLRYLVPS